MCMRTWLLEWLHIIGWLMALHFQPILDLKEKKGVCYLKKKNTQLLLYKVLNLSTLLAINANYFVNYSIFSLQLSICCCCVNMFLEPQIHIIHSSYYNPNKIMIRSTNKFKKHFNLWCFSHFCFYVILDLKCIFLFGCPIINLIIIQTYLQMFVSSRKFSCRCVTCTGL